MVFAKSLCPLLKLSCPLVLILAKSILPFKNEFELIVTIELVPEHAHHVYIELVQIPEIRMSVFPDHNGHVIHHTKGIGSEEIFYFYEVDKILKQG